MVRRQNVGLHTDTVEKLTEGRGKIARSRTPNPSGIAIKGQHRRAPVATQEGYHRLEGGLSMKVFMGLGVEQNAGACIDKIAGFDHMSALGIGIVQISRHRGDIFKVHLHLC